MKKVLRALSKPQNQNKGEYYLTDLVKLAIKNRLRLETFKADDPLVSIGINTPDELKKSDLMMRKIKKLTREN